MKRVAIALVACGGTSPTPTVTVEPLPSARVVSSSAPLPPLVRTTAPAAPEVLAPGARASRRSSSPRTTRRKASASS